ILRAQAAEGRLKAAAVRFREGSILIHRSRWRHANGAVAGRYLLDLYVFSPLDQDTPQLVGEQHSRSIRQVDNEPEALTFLQSVKSLTETSFASHYCYFNVFHKILQPDVDSGSHP